MCVGKKSAEEGVTVTQTEYSYLKDRGLIYKTELLVDVVELVFNY